MAEGECNHFLFPALPSTYPHALAGATMLPLLLTFCFVFLALVTIHSPLGTLSFLSSFHSAHLSPLLSSHRHCILQCAACVFLSACSFLPLDLVHFCVAPSPFFLSDLFF